MEALENYIAIIITVIFLIIIPLNITKEYNSLYEQNNKEHHVNEIVWQIEQERCVHVELLKYDFKIECFTKNGEMVFYTPSKNNKFPENVKYVHIIYGKESRWLIFG